MVVAWMTITTLSLEPYSSCTTIPFVRSSSYIPHPRDGKMMVDLACKETQQLKPLNVAAPYHFLFPP